MRRASAGLEARLNTEFGFSICLLKVRPRNKIPHKKNLHCGFNRVLDTDGTLDVVASEPERPQFVAIWEFDSYDDLTRFVAEALHQKFAREIAIPVVRRRWVVNI